MDQDSWADVLPDMASGYMLFSKAWFCLPEVCLEVPAVAMRLALNLVCAL